MHQQDHIYVLEKENGAFMTAEIAIMNKEAIALAADSALTTNLGSTAKIFPSANKIFRLSKYHPVGIMVFGNATFMDMPWEILIKTYRNKLCKKRFARLEEYAQDFIKFLGENPLIKTSLNTEQKEFFMKKNILYYFSYIRDSIDKRVEQEIKNKGSIDEQEIKTIIKLILKTHQDNWVDCDPLPDLPENLKIDIINKYKDHINGLVSEVFEELPLTKGQRGKLVELASLCMLNFSKNQSNPLNSGVVVAGFGEEDLFPSLISYDIESMIEDKIKYKLNSLLKIDMKKTALIVPFAQKEMVSAFMEGVDPYYRIIKDVAIEKTFKNYAKLIAIYLGLQSDKRKIRKMEKIGEVLLKNLTQDLKAIRGKNYSQPIVSIVSGLPKDELASMAESLVSLTSFKRRVSPQSETVGGPIDVALISKGDGFIWVKRKHYFKLELNPQFQDNYYKECRESSGGE